MSEVTTSIFLETRIPLKNGLYPVKSRVNYERKRKYFSVIIRNRCLRLTEADFEAIMTAIKRSDTRKKLDELLDKADCIIETLEPFSFHEINAKWNTRKAENNDLFRGYRDTIARLKNEYRVWCTGI